MSRRYFWERDGGPVYMGSRTSHQPYTYYVIDRLGDPCDGRIDCETRHEARELAERLNDAWAKEVAAWITTLLSGNVPSLCTP